MGQGGVSSQVSLRASNARLQYKRRSHESLNVKPALWFGQMRGLVGFAMGLLDHEYTQCGFVAWWGAFWFHCALRMSLREMPPRRHRAEIYLENQSRHVQCGSVFVSKYIAIGAGSSSRSSSSGVKSSQVKLILSPKQRAKPAASRTRTCTNAAVCIAGGECPSRF